MKSFICLFSVIIFIGFTTTTAFAQTQDRRMVLVDFECHEPAAESKDEDSNCLVELVNVQIAGQKITSGKMFVADENWLKNLKVRVKNVSGRPFVFVGVGFGLMEGLYEELAPYASWKWAFSLARGKASNPYDEKRKISKKVILKPNEEIELTYVDLPDLYRKANLMRVVGKMGQIVLQTATVEFEDGEQTDSFFFIKEK